MKEILKEDSKKGLVLNLLIMAAIGLVIILLFFYAYLPVTTNHGATLPVPDLRGKSQEEVAKIMKENKLRYEVIDSTYSPDLDPLQVVRQYPTAGANVKKKRKIYLTVNNINAPTVKVPAGLIGHSFENAQVQLRRVGLRVGRVTEEFPKPGEAVGANRILGVIVNEQEVTEKDLERGISVEKGAAIDLIKTKGGKKKSISSSSAEGGENATLEDSETP